ncbi:nitrate reductase molybdenum cofactor assembly chaperone [Virgibacillus byunsanensis]|uniref:Nitrate reductase molybdenum cofactor assembly chaperone n=1 Tax=Virgibacillus byunsanensis TaxID=570945 RepID=A0ABW3LQ01_9BACI
MESLQSNLLIIASRMLSYPTREDEQAVTEALEDMDLEDDVKKTVGDALDKVYRIPLHDRWEIYVSTFDLKEKTGLYLSAHEFGDSPKRGAALIRLQKIVNEAGYERMDGELADYIPMMYEFVAVTYDHPESERLKNRLACVTHRIFNQLHEENPFYHIISVLMQYVFDAPTKEELVQLEQQREKADLEELPYPIMYK